MSGLIAKKAIELGLKVPWWVKTSFAPGSRVKRVYEKSRTSKISRPVRV